MNQPLTTKLKPLSANAMLGVIATGSPLSPERWAKGTQSIERLGLRWKTPFDPTSGYGAADRFVAADPGERARGFYSLLQDREVEAILAVRGAYGAMEVLPRLDMEHVRAAGKTLIGMSDVTVLLAQFAFRAGLPAIHGPTLGSSFADYDADPAAKESVDTLLELLRNPAYGFNEQLEVLRPGEGQGRILAANLTMLLTLLGTPWDIDYSGAILVLEDVGEAPYRVHRALMQLKLAGKLDRLAGLVFARFSKCASANGPSVEQVMEMAVKDIFPSAPYPVARGLEAGHWGKNLPLPLGCLAKIQGNRLSLLESPLG